MHACMHSLGGLEAPVLSSVQASQLLDHIRHWASSRTWAVGRPLPPLMASMWPAAALPV